MRKQLKSRTASQKSLSLREARARKFRAELAAKYSRDR